MILGTDISHWQDDDTTVREINFQMMKAAGAEFTIIKVSQGLWTDHVFKNSWGDAKGVLPRGGYHWLSWNKTGLEQAKYYCDAIAYDLPEITPVVDFEDRVGVPYNANGHLWNWLDYVEDQLNKIPMIYTGPAFWKEFGSTDEAWAKYPLWIANYYVEKPTIPAPWTTWTLWQYTPKGNGTKYGVESLQIDLDYFNGTKEDFIKFCGNQPPSEPTHDEKVEILWRDADDAGWNMNK
jgi:lysozyme